MPSTKSNTQRKQVRDAIVRAIELLIEEPSRQEEAERILEHYYHHFNQKEHIFSLISIVYGGFVKAARTSEFQRDSSALSTLRDQLQGRVPYWNTYAQKYDFVELLRGDALEAYRKLRRLLTLVADSVESTSPINQDRSEDYQALRHSLYELCYDRLETNTIDRLLVAHSCHVLLSLPDDGSKYFDIDDSFHFSSIYPVSSMESMDAHLNYVESMLQRLEGKAVLFVDVHLSPEGFVLNLR